MIEVLFLGTASMYPTDKRSQSCVFVKSGPENVLFDCGEGAQRQMRIAGLSLMKINRIFITHWHGDHALGLAGIIQSLSASKSKDELEIYGPKGTSEHVKHMLKSFRFDLCYKIKTFDVSPKPNSIKRIFETESFAVEAMPVKHIIPCLSFSFIEKGHRKINIEFTKKFGLKQHPLLGKLQQGKDITFEGKKISAKAATYMTPDKKVSYIIDTSYFKGVEKIAKDADLLICESTYNEELKEKAGAYTHLTAKDAAEIAKKANAKKLVLTHFSQRFVDTRPLVEEAKKVFNDVHAANDFDKFEVK
jgi:ribonuclease Z